MNHRWNPYAQAVIQGLFLEEPQLGLMLTAAILIFLIIFERLQIRGLAF